MGGLVCLWVESMQNVKYFIKGQRIPGKTCRGEKKAHQNIQSGIIQTRAYYFSSQRSKHYFRANYRTRKHQNENAQNLNEKKKRNYLHSIIRERDSAKKLELEKSNKTPSARRPSDTKTNAGNVGHVPRNIANELKIRH